MSTRTEAQIDDPIVTVRVIGKWFSKGPASLVRMPTLVELEKARAYMASVRHVNRLIIEADIDRIRDGKEPCIRTVVQLLALESSELGLNSERFAARYGVVNFHSDNPPKDLAPIYNCSECGAVRFAGERLAPGTPDPRD